MVKYGIFVSYSRRDASFASQIADLLRHLAPPYVDVWIDYRDIRPADRWRDEIQAALASRHLLILILSPDAVASEYVRQEYSVFLHTERPILPLYYREAALPEAISAIQYIDCRPYGRAPAPEAWNALAEQVSEAVWRERLAWLNGLFAEQPPAQRPPLAGDLVKSGDPQAVDALVHQFELELGSELADDTIAQWYIHHLGRMASDEAREALRRLRDAYGTEAHPLLKRAFARCKLLKGDDP